MAIWGIYLFASLLAHFGLMEVSSGHAHHRVASDYPFCDTLLLFTARLGPRGKVLVGLRRIAGLAGQFCVGQTLAYNLPHQITEAITVRHRQAVVMSECLFIQVPE